LEAVTAPNFVVNSLIPAEGITLLAAESKTGESELACDIAYAVATGTPFLGQEITQPGNVLIISTEETPLETAARYKSRGFKDIPDVNKTVKFLHKFTLNRLDLLQKYILENNITFLVLDNLKSLTAGLKISEKSPKFSDLLRDLNKLLIQCNCAGLMIYHANKSKKGSLIAKINSNSAITAHTMANLFLEIHNNQLILTGKGRYIPETALELTLNPRHQWNPQGIYSISQKSEVRRQQATGKEATGNKEEANSNTEYSTPNTPSSTVKKIRQTRQKVAITDTIKEILQRSPGLTEQEIINEALKLSLKQKAIQTAIKKMLKNEDISIQYPHSQDTTPEDRYINTPTIFNRDTFSDVW